jgi:hypothetical protein
MDLPWRKSSLANRRVVSNLDPEKGARAPCHCGQHSKQVRKDVTMRTVGSASKGLPRSFSNQPVSGVSNAS